MRCRPLLLMALLVGPLALSGCMSGGGADTPRLGEDEAYVRIFVKKPLGIDRHPFWSLEAAPRLVAFIAGDNDTREKLLGPGYTDLALGWPAGWNASAAGREYPASALQNWLKPQGLWYEGIVPAGNYSTIRIELVEVIGARSNGEPLDVVLMGDRLSIGPAEGDVFHIEAGDTETFVFESAITKTGAHTYMIR